MKVETLIDLEHQFWRAIRDEDVDAAVALLNEPALMVSAHGLMKFDHAAYRKMATQGKMVLTAFEFSDLEVVFPNEQTAILTYRVKQTMAPRGTSAGKVQHMNDASIWLKVGDRWRCSMHTECPAQEAA
ncbi:MAG: nuclear transport factor 2 family protein [Pseudomonadota bacterium]